VIFAWVKKYPSTMLLIGLWLTAALTAFHVLFTTWAFYDDEGYVLWSLIHFSQGNTLYADIFSQYGPGFYILDTAFRILLPIPYTTDGQRWQTLIFWLASTAILAHSFNQVAISPASHSCTRGKMFWSMFFLFLVFWHQEKLALEPGHPQIWCTLLVAISIYLLASKTNTTSHLPSPTFTVALGMIAAMSIMIKPNIGLLLLASFPATYLWSVSKPTRWFRYLELAYTIGLLAIPWLLTYKQLSSLDTFLLPTLVTASLLALRTLALPNLRVWFHSLEKHSAWDNRQRVAHLFALIACAAVMLGLILLWCLQHNIDLWLLKRALFGQHDTLLELYFFPAIRSILGLSVLMATALFLVVLGAKSSGYWIDFCQFLLIHSPPPKRQNIRWRNLQPNPIPVSLLFLSLTLLAALILWGDALTPLVHGLRPRGCAELLLAASPAILSGWLLLRFPRASKESSANQSDPSANRMPSQDHLVPRDPNTAAYPYVGIAVIAALQPLIAFPVPGTQLSLGTLPLLLILIDGCRLAVECLANAWSSKLPTDKPLRLKTSHVMLLSTLAVLPCLLATQRYLARPSLGLPGATTLRLSQADRVATHELISAIHGARADAFVFRWHNRPSWYLWAQATPPYHQLPPSWTYLVSLEQQNEQLKKLRHYSKVLIIDEHYAPRKIPPASPLHQAWESSTHYSQYGTDFSLRLWSPP